MLVFVFVGQFKTDRAGAGHYIPAISGRIGFVHNQRHRCALTRCLFKLVGPAAVIGHGFASEKFCIAGGKARVIDKHHHSLAFDVDIFIVVPAIFRRDDAVADKYQFAVFHFNLRLHPRRPGHHLCFIGKTGW